LHSFLEILANEILKKHNDRLSNLCIVFPSRRAGVFFKNTLVQKISNPIFSPVIYGIQDFIAELSPHTIAEKLALIFELYESYITAGEEESFDRFYPWGEMMLNDFDDIDKNLVEADRLFRILREHKEIEERFEFSPDDSEDFVRFWKTFSNRELTDRQIDFIKTWEIMGRVYRNFKKKLAEKNICYEGMAYRKIYEMLKTNAPSSVSPPEGERLVIKYDIIIFAGFNQLNKAEESIMKELIKSGKAELYWDADEYYVNNDLMEAGKFLRQNFINLKQNEPEWISSNFAGSGKNITITGGSLQSGQAKALGYLLEKTTSVSPPDRGSGSDAQNTAVILPDESMLLPVLHSIPDNIASLNVTMGYPFKSSLMYNFIKSLFNLQKNKKGEGAKTVYYHKDCSEILSGPYIKLIAAESCFKVINEINNLNIIYITSGRIQSIAGKKEIIFDIIFNNINSSSEIITYLFKILSAVSAAFEEKSPESFRFEKEFIFALYSELNRLESLIAKFKTELEAETMWKLLIEIMENLRIPFTGEPLKGLQVMGLLETRSLDFDNIYILSMNEGTVPRSGSNGSYIPYHLRKAFKMPTYEDDDASFAYYFYSLIQRAKNINLIYNTETSGLMSGEKSRFIMQIEKELTKYNKNIKLKSFIFQAGIDEVKNKDITISKTPQIIDFLSKMIYSASSLSDYILCTLKFYLNRIAGLKKEESVEEAFSGAAFGNLLHEIMKQLYEQSRSSEITEKEILKFKTRIQNEFDEIWSNACNKIPELTEFARLQNGQAAGLYGKNLLFKNVIKKLVELILDNDLLNIPFKIVEIEKKLKSELEIKSHGNNLIINLTGRLDRVEEKDGIIRIIDYKTGSFTPKRQGGKTVDEYFEKVFAEPEYKESFQQYYYAMLFQNINPDAKINIGVYPLKSISKGIEFYEDDFLSAEKLGEFTKKLSSLFNEILNPEISFIKTEDIERCKYCDFRSICYRES